MPTVRAGDLPYQGFQTEVPSPQVPSAYQNIRATPEDFGAGIGTALSNLGGVIERSASQFAENAIQRQELENKIKADDSTNKYQEAITKLLYGDPDNPAETGFLQKRGEDAARAYPEVYKNIIKLRDEMRGQLANPKQQLLFDGETRRSQLYTLQHMGSHYDREFKNYATATNEASAKNGLAQAATGLEQGDQAAFEDGLGKTMRARLDQAKLAGTASPEVVNNILGEVRADGVKLQFQKLSETNPYKAWQFLEANTDALKPGEAHALRQSVAAKYNDIRAKIDAGEMPAPEGWNEKPPVNVPDPQTSGVGHVAPKAERLEYYKQKAQELGLNYNAIVATVSNEGLNVYVGDGGKSFGDFQLYTGGGMGNEAVAAGIKIDDPRTWKQQADFALQKMAEHKGDPEWFNGQWHGPRDHAPWTAHVFGKPDSAPAAKTAAPAATIDMAFGDSNAQLATNHGVPGKEDTIVGEQPAATLARMQAKGPDYFKGKTVIMSGPTNNPDDIASVEKQVQFLQGAGARFVIPGVGPGIRGNADVVNAQLAGLAQKYSVPFVMPTAWQKDGIHIAQVPKFLEKVKAEIGSAPTPAPPQTIRASAVASSGGGRPTVDELDILEGGGGGDAPDTITPTQRFPGLKLAPIEPPEPGQLPDAEVPGLQDRITEIANQPWAKEDPVRMNAAIKAARQGANARHTEQQRSLQAHKQIVDANNEAARRKYIERMTGGEAIPEAAIGADKNLTAAGVENMISFQRSLARGGDPDAATDRANWAKLLNRVVAPYGTEDKITTIDPLVAAATNKEISRQSLHDLIGFVDKQKNEYGTTTQKLKDRFITLFKPLVEGPAGALGLSDPDKEARFANFQLAVDKLVTDQGKAGKDPSELFRLKDDKDQYSSPIGQLAKQFASPFRASMMPPAPGTPVDYKTAEDVKAAIGKTLTYEQAVDILVKRFGKTPPGPQAPIAPSQIGP